MIRTTAEASNTSLPVRSAAISADTILADQLLRCRFKVLPALLVCHGLEGCEGLAAPLTGIAPAGLLQIAEGLLAEAAVVSARPQLQRPRWGDAGRLHAPEVQFAAASDC